MPHPRNRYCVQAFERKLKFQRVVLVQGVRQCGKSFFLRELFAKENQICVYVTLDQPSEKQFARDNPETFIRRLSESELVIIDEAQKAPILFDTVKFFVDLDPRPGQFVLAGSTEFSIKSNIRESLTGRATSIRLFPLTLGEALCKEARKLELFPLQVKKPLASRAEFIRHLNSGGMPGLCFVHDKGERNELIADWLQLTTQRDIQQLPGPKKDSTLARDIIQQVAMLEEPTVAQIAKTLRTNARRVNAHVEALKTLFALVEIPTSRFGTGKPRLYLCDVGFATHCGASFKRQLETLYLQEILAFRSYFGSDRIGEPSYYRTSKGSIVDFILQDSKTSYKCIKIHDRETINQLDVRIFKNLSSKMKFKTSFICAAGVAREQEIDGVRIIPWEGVIG